MSKLILKSSKLFLVALVIITLVLAPEVGAASDAIKTETEPTEYNNIIDAVDDQLNLTRAITIDEAKKEAALEVEEQLSIIAESQTAEEADEPETEPEVQEAEEETEAESFVEDFEEPEEVDEPETEDVSADDETEADESSSDNDDADSENNAYYEASFAGYLMDIDDPDPGYVSYSVSLSDTDRDMAERIIMGEAGSMGYTGMALVAQCLRDTYIMGSYGSISDVIYSNGYYGSTSITPSATCKEVVNYIFDQGGAAVPHRILTFYASNYCSSAWHESQNYICSCGYVRFFDSWT